MSDRQVFGLPPGVFVVWCGNRPVPVTQDPASMSSQDRDAICNGMMRFRATDVALVVRDDGHYDSEIIPT